MWLNILKLSDIDDKDFEQFVALGKKLQINSIDPQYKTIDQTNCLEVLRISDDPMSREQAMRLTLENFKTVRLIPIKFILFFDYA